MRPDCRMVLAAGRAVYVLAAPDPARVRARVPQFDPGAKSQSGARNNGPKFALAFIPEWGLSRCDTPKQISLNPWVARMLDKSTRRQRHSQIGLRTTNAGPQP